MTSVGVPPKNLMHALARRVEPGVNPLVRASLNATSTPIDSFLVLASAD
jgi:hypothetical protein